MRLVSWRFWAALAALAGTWIGLGFIWDTSSTAIKWFSDTGIVAVPVAVLIFMIVYGIIGKWWKTDFGNRLVMLPLSAMWIALMLVWAVFFHKGLINTPLSAWMFTGGYLFQAGMLFWGSFLWIRAAREDKRLSALADPDVPVEVADDHAPVESAERADDQRQDDDHDDHDQQGDQPVRDEPAHAVSSTLSEASETIA